MVAMRESVGEFVKPRSRGVSVQKPKKLRLDPLADPRFLAARHRRSPRFALQRPLRKQGHHGRANHEGHRGPGRPTLGRAESGMAIASGPNRDGQVTTALCRSRTLGLPVPTQAKRRISARQSRSTADGDTCRVCKRAICRCSNRSRQQPWRPRPGQSGARRIRPCWGRSIQWN